MLMPKSALSAIVHVCNIACGMMEAGQIVSRRARTSSRSSSSGSTSAAETAAAAAAAEEAAELWVVLLTRCLLFFGAALERVASWDGMGCSAQYADCAGRY
jgi:hypothetical protein